MAPAQIDIERARRAAAAAFWRGIGWSASELREVEARISEWAEREAPGALDAIDRRQELARRVAARIGPEALRAYDRFNAMQAEGAEAVGARVHAFVEGAVACGAFTRQQADDFKTVVAVAMGVAPLGAARRLARNRVVIPHTDPRFHFPVTRRSGRVGGDNLTGEPAVVSERANNRLDIERQNEAARILGAAGYSIHQNPSLSDDERRLAGVGPRKNPDMIIEGRVFDVYSPGTDNSRNLRGRIARKVSEGQARRIVVNLQNSTLTRAELERSLRRDPIFGLQEVITIDQEGRIGHAFP